MLQVRALWACIPEALSALEDCATHRAASTVTMRSTPQPQHTADTGPPGALLDSEASSVFRTSNHRRKVSSRDSNSTRSGRRTRPKSAGISGVLAFDPDSSLGATVTTGAAASEANEPGLTHTCPLWHLIPMQSCGPPPKARKGKHGGESKGYGAHSYTTILQDHLFIEASLVASYCGMR